MQILKIVVSCRYASKALAKNLSKLWLTDGSRDQKKLGYFLGLLALVQTHLSKSKCSYQVIPDNYILLYQSLCTKQCTSN